MLLHPNLWGNVTWIFQSLFPHSGAVWVLFAQNGDFCPVLPQNGVCQNGDLLSGCVVLHECNLGMLGNLGQRVAASVWEGSLLASIARALYRDVRRARGGWAYRNPYVLCRASYAGRPV